ncbi:hypothetical protein L596_015332 [Steinernema carpocapsae]|uniref:Uncharacterized protein n=1 Tax=Steinernema carpocapsae TaxID=34508 RepID=A0A4U5NEV8_STECR|nr:hypothetical protein L596_015332 [Steinernema carpocapsae]
MLELVPQTSNWQQLRVKNYETAKTASALMKAEQDEHRVRPTTLLESAKRPLGTYFKKETSRDSAQGPGA